MTPRRPVPGGTAGDPPQGSPEQFPVNPPPGFQSADHSWVLQTIMELQKSSGQMTQAVQTLTDVTKKQGDKLDSISHRMYAAAAVLTVIGAIAYFFLDRMFSNILAVLTKLQAIK